MDDSGAVACRMGLMERLIKPYGILLAILLLGLWLRMDNLLLHAMDWDETNVLAISQLPVKDLIWFVTTHDIHPPGVHLSLALWTAFFGTGDFALRGFAVFWSVVAIWAAWLLALEISKSRGMSHLTALFTALLPVAIRYSHFATSPSIYHALVLFSWFFFLKVLALPAQAKLSRNRWFWLYLATTFWAMQQYAAGPFYVFFQGLYFLLVRKRVPHQRAMLWTGILLVVSNIPHLLVIFQPWHMAQSHQLKTLHPDTPWLFFLASPLSLLFYNYDLRVDMNDLSLFPPLQPLLIYGLFTYGLLSYAFWQIRKQHPEIFRQILWIGVFPLLGAYLLNFIGLHFFNFRAMLYVIFPFCFALAFLVQALWQKRRALAGLLLVMIVGMQMALHAPLQAYTSMDWRIYANNIRKVTQPGDGLIIYPGLMYLPMMHYFRPQDGGISPLMLQTDPRKGDNWFNEVERIDDRYFWVSGDEVLHRPEVQQAFVDFQKKHRRLVWMLQGAPPQALLPLVDCTKEMWIVDMNGGHRAHCHQ